MPAEPFIIDRERYPYVLRTKEKRPICAVYANDLLTTIANLPKILEELNQLRATLESFERRLQSEEALKILDEAVSGRCSTSTALERLVELRYAPVLKASGYSAPKEEVKAETDSPEVGQIWSSKRRTQDSYLIESVSNGIYHLVWLGSNKYTRDVNESALRKNYIYQSRQSA